MRLLLRSPKDVVAGGLAFAAVTAIVANALFLQAGPHPSPMFGSVVVMPAALPLPANPLPRPRPVEATTRPAEISRPEPKPAEPRPSDLKASDKASEVKPSDPRVSDPLTNLVKATTNSPQVATSAIPRPPASIPVSHDSGIGPGGSRRVAAVQRALAEFGYGQLTPTGTI